MARADLTDAQRAGLEHAREVLRRSANCGECGWHARFHVDGEEQSEKDTAALAVLDEMLGGDAKADEANRLLESKGMR